MTVALMFGFFTFFLWTHINCIIIAPLPYHLLWFTTMYECFLFISVFIRSFMKEIHFMENLMKALVCQKISPPVNATKGESSIYICFFVVFRVTIFVDNKLSSHYVD